MFSFNRNILLIVGAVASIGLVPVVAVIATGDIGAISSLAPAKSFMALLAERSPGERTTAKLTKTKAKMAALSTSGAAFVPRQRALAKVQPAKTADIGRILAGPAIVAPLAGIPALAVLPPVETAARQAPPIGGIIAPPLGGVVAGGGGGTGGGPGGGGTVPPPAAEVPPIIPAVPEPGTWAMLLIGFFGCGVALRRRPSGRQVAAY